MYILNYAEIYSEKCMVFQNLEIIFIFVYESCMLPLHSMTSVYHLESQQYQIINYCHFDKHPQNLSYIFVPITAIAKPWMAHRQQKKGKKHFDHIHMNDTELDMVCTMHKHIPANFLLSPKHCIALSHCVECYALKTDCSCGKINGQKFTYHLRICSTGMLNCRQSWDIVFDRHQKNWTTMLMRLVWAAFLPFRQLCCWCH